MKQNEPQDYCDMKLCRELGGAAVSDGGIVVAECILEGRMLFKSNVFVKMNKH